MPTLPRLDPQKTNSWSKLHLLKKDWQERTIMDCFYQNPNRATEFSILQGGDLFYDYSKHRVDKEVMDALCELAAELGLEEAIRAQFLGKRINETEQRAVLHTALRLPKDAQLVVDGEDIVPKVHHTLDRMDHFAEKVISGEWKGHTGKPIASIVNIGIGGSDLGPVMAYEALKPWHNHLKVHFVSNVDGSHIHNTLAQCDPETTLFVVVSKTFTTQETLANASTAKEWLTVHLGTQDAVSLHFAAVSTQLSRVEAFGISAQNCFGFWDWVGGRFSLWSSVGLAVVLGVGMKHFKELLAGAHEIDNHFQHSPFHENIPVIMALLEVWYVNFWGCRSRAVIPYDQLLHRFPAYLQQAEMESHGKTVNREGKKIDYHTGAVVWGEPGTNGQHAFFQLLHQGSSFIPVDFIVAKTPQHPYSEQHKILLANCIAQSEALLKGRSVEEVLAESPKLNTHDASFKVFEGNRPSSSLIFDELSPQSIGKLIAMYEHKIFVQGIIWNIHSYDQFGVELGKRLAKEILSEVKINQANDSLHDGSTLMLIHRLLS